MVYQKIIEQKVVTQGFFAKEVPQPFEQFVAEVQEFVDSYFNIGYEIVNVSYLVVPIVFGVCAEAKIRYKAIIIYKDKSK